MQSTTWLLRLATVMAIWVPGYALGDQTDPRLDELFATLQTNQDETVLQATETEIWGIWYDSGEQAADDKMQHAAELVRRGKLAAAEQIYTEIIEMLPGFSEGWNRRATVRYYQGDFAGSLADIEETLRLEPRHFGAIWGLGMILGSRRDYERAILAFERLLKIKPNAADARPRIESLKRQMALDSV